MKLAQLWEQRSTLNFQGKRVPTFWNPVAPKPEGLANKPLLALLTGYGLSLELPVGQLVGRQLQKVGEPTAVLRNLLKANQADEAQHDKGFRMLAEALGEEYQPLIGRGRAIGEVLIEEVPDTEPITLAGLLEVTCFLPFLGLIRLEGGSEGSRFALGINQDEQRHVATNAAVSKALGLPLPKQFPQFRPIRDALFEPLREHLSEDTWETFYSASNELAETLDSPTLNRMARVTSKNFFAPFEVANQTMYARTLGGPK